MLWFLSIGQKQAEGCGGQADDDHQCLNTSVDPPNRTNDDKRQESHQRPPNRGPWMTAKDQQFYRKDDRSHGKTHSCLILDASAIHKRKQRQREGPEQYCGYDAARAQLFFSKASVFFGLSTYIM